MSSQTSGARNKAGTRTGAGKDKKDRDTVEVELADSRWRHFAWALVGCVLGPVLMFWFGGAGLVVGAVILVSGLVAVRGFVRTFAHEAGTIIITTAEARLPVKLCSGHTDVVKLEDIRSAYLLNRAVPWTTAGPLLVIETASQVFEYPRDWFAGDGDQQAVMHALNRQLGIA